MKSNIMKPDSERPDSFGLELRTSAEWNDALWAQIFPIYSASFPAHIRKPERIVRDMLNVMDAFLHVGLSEGVPCSMAVTGLSSDKRLLIVDYLAVSPGFRQRGAGKQTTDALADWARETYGVSGLLLEAEVDNSKESRDRQRFWERCGFESTEYVHRYVWVPEKYRAMLLDLQSDTERSAEPLSRDGKQLFRQIEAFHKLSFKK
ncbi:GNAT family N-acetyltransferase [Saccharibacillus sacchari]|uniref:GNAT family N-acetyltransferase n=1 Tax=Saccharibacillus sacchari TaxID=456493 RepID=A0ACC6PJW8_9BACL